MTYEYFYETRGVFYNHMMGQMQKILMVVSGFGHKFDHTTLAPRFNHQQFTVAAMHYAYYHTPLKYLLLIYHHIQHNDRTNL